ncbi:Calcium-dependent protein kinase 2 [Babesia sp. Xinjiang]|uniref:Calcium-dependent protein kinase 2 n=1 Tax=Babesia sp. Xinjiang TaxID=462227 RepID=UPI000A22D50C|nr:Calcium-dependent protein kinase 2 [Babesia sp. Xinjiang]XP_028871458.1 Calcium-dependent protein kinase 2 [Babesia sp. Xinjiang]ORM40879.1 Calcium-dependent protein kinase 2 [Babesia sp. Xinjiang]ORM41002.1 Calcium-dependent protein kinase 2 [Babesia sp. Xinjiang]
MSATTTKKLLRYESIYRSSRSNCTHNNQASIMTAYAESNDATPLVQCKDKKKRKMQKNGKNCYDERGTLAKLNLKFNRFTPVVKGGWATYRRKYLEGPVIGKGSFGVVKALFSLVDLINLQQALPVREQLPTNRLGQAIKRIDNDHYEFYGKPLPPPTRAVKIMNVKSSHRIKDFKDALHILREITIGAWLDHPNVVKVSEIYTNRFEDISELSNEVFHEKKFKGAIPTNFTKVYLVMEYCSGGDLSSRKIPKEFREETVARMFVHVFRALSYINTLGVAHRDVKPENFMWANSSPDADVKITDFGLANSPMHTLTTRAGTAYYVAPEIVRYAPQRLYSVQCDSWSAGVMLHKFLLDFCPFQADTDVTTLFKVVNEDVNWTDPRYKLLSPDAYDLLRKLLVKEPTERISTSEALNHPWLRRAIFEVTNIPMTVEDATGVLDSLTAFYRCPVLKQLALSIMARQTRDEELQEWRRKYLFLSMFSEDQHFWININTVEKWLTCTRETTEASPRRNVPGKRSIYMCAECMQEDGNECKSKDGEKHQFKRRFSVRQSMLWKAVSRLTDLLTNFSDHKMTISFTEFLAAQVMEKNVHKSESILDTFAGLRSEMAGRRSILIDAQDLRRLLNPMYSCTNTDLDDVLRQTELIALSTYLNSLAMEEESMPRVYHLLKHLLDPKTALQPMNLTIDEFFVLMKSSEDVAPVEETLKYYEGSPSDAYETVKRKLICTKLREIEDYCEDSKRQKKVRRTTSAHSCKAEHNSRISTPRRRITSRGRPHYV